MSDLKRLDSIQCSCSGSNGELQELTSRLVDRATAYGMEVRTGENKTIMSNSTNNTTADISMSGQKLEEVTSFKYLEATMYKDGICSAEVRMRVASAMATMARLKRIWRCNTISFASKFKLYKSFVTSVLVYGCEMWTLIADSEKRTQAFETKCHRKLLRIPYLEHMTNDWVRNKTNSLVGPQEPLLATFGRRKLAWLGHVTRVRHNSFFKPTPQGPSEGGQSCGRQRNCWMNNIKEWTSLPMPKLLTRAYYWKRISAELYLMSPRRPSWWRDRTELKLN